MSPSEWILTICVFIGVVLLALGIGWIIRNRLDPTPAPPNKYTAPQVWSQPVLGPNKDKRVCQLYSFPTTIVDIDGVPTAVPGNPSFNPEILDNLAGVSGTYPFCVDSDQLIAHQLAHTCIAPQGVVDGSITTCNLIAGGYTGVGGSEVFYSGDGCYKVPLCAGQLSLVSVNFQSPGNSDIHCLQTFFNTEVNMAPCNPSLGSQLYRITRIDPGQNPFALQPGQGQNGLIAQLLDRVTGQCITAGEDITSTIYDPKYLQNSSCSGATESIAGTSVVLSTCTGGIFPGYVWAMLPSVVYCPSPTGCTTDYNPEDPNHGCTAGSKDCNFTTPPQMVYIGNLDIENIPLGTGYAGLTGASAIVQWFVDNDAKSLYWGGTGPGLILTDFATNVGICKQKPYTAQYMTITQYNTTSQEAVCLAAGTLGTVNCTGL
jgi:hypothetical protein